MKQRGISIVELIVSLFLLFLASSFLMGMFLSASGAPARLEKGRQLEQLASFKMDEIMVADLGTVPSDETGTFPDFPEYQYTVTTRPTDFDPDMLTVVVVATDPDGQRQRLVALKPNRAPVPPPPPPPETAFDAESFKVVPIEDPEPEDDPPEPPVPIPPPQAVIDNACLSCHGGEFPTAPIWNLDSIETSADAAGQSPTNYIISSIQTPGAYVVPGYGYPLDPNDPDSPEGSPMEGSTNVSPEDAQMIANWILSGGTNYDDPWPPGQGPGGPGGPGENPGPPADF